jgi:predicted lipoprotein with Yx(FWY)xxD motif
LLSWPVFDAGARSLGYGLSDDAFGSFQRPDGAWQTTYMGWPLYFYKNDLLAGDLTGQGKGRTWIAAETVLPNILVMRSSEETGGLKYLSTERGLTLYAYAGDTLGTPDMLPASTCLGECLEDYQPFVVHSLRPSSAIEPQDLTVFARPDTGELQLAYKGKPLYASKLDDRSGDLNGIAAESWGLVEL